MLVKRGTLDHELCARMSSIRVAGVVLFVCVDKDVQAVERRLPAEDELNQKLIAVQCSIYGLNVK